MSYDEAKLALVNYVVKPPEPVESEPFATGRASRATVMGFAFDRDTPEVKLCFGADAKLMSVTINFGDAAVYSQILDGLKTKYGDATSESPHKVTNWIDGSSLTWLLPSTRIVLSHTIVSDPKRRSQRPDRLLMLSYHDRKRLAVKL
jgi:hypothetical protein